jgi:hypothetical protein
MARWESGDLDNLRAQAKNDSRGNCFRMSNAVRRLWRFNPTVLSLMMFRREYPELVAPERP